MVADVRLRFAGPPQGLPRKRTVSSNTGAMPRKSLAIATTIWPELTTIRQPLVRMAERAVQILVGDATDDGATGEICIPAEIKIRESTAPAPR